MARNPTVSGCLVMLKELAHALSRLLICTVGGAALIGSSSMSHAAEIYREDAVKAAFLYRFTRYVDWPESALNTPEFTIGVMAGDEVAEKLTQLLSRQPQPDRPVRVRMVGSAAAAKDVQVLYIGRNFSGDLRTLTEALASLPILIVTDHWRGLDEGGMLNFVLLDRRVRFEVSLPAAQRAGLKLRSDLLSVAARVKGSPLGMWNACSPSERLHELQGRCESRVVHLWR